MRLNRQRLREIENRLRRITEKLGDGVDSHRLIEDADYIAELLNYHRDFDED